MTKDRKQATRKSTVEVLSAAASKDHKLLVNSIVNLESAERAAVLHTLANYVIFLWEKTGIDPDLCLAEVGLWVAQQDMHQAD